MEALSNIIQTYLPLGSITFYLMKEDQYSGNFLAEYI